MNKKKVTISWSINIALYIANIVIVCIKGVSLATCILGWLVASMLAGLIICLQCRLIDKQKTVEPQNQAEDGGKSKGI